MSGLAPTPTDTRPTSGVRRKSAMRSRPFHSLNNYGLFATMTNPRREIVIEGSADGPSLAALRIPVEAGRLVHGPRVRRTDATAARLADVVCRALGPLPQSRHWFLPLVAHLLQGTPEVTALFAHNPFPEASAQGGSGRHLYEYHFTDLATRRAAGPVVATHPGRHFSSNPPASGGTGDLQPRRSQRPLKPPCRWGRPRFWGRPARRRG